MPNKQELKFHAKARCEFIKNTVLRVVAKFPPDAGWGYRHINHVLVKIIENPNRTVEQYIDSIKRSWLESGKGWRVDGGKEHVPLTQEEIDFNRRMEEEKKHAE